MKLSKLFTVLAIGLFASSAMAEGTPAMVSIAARLINSNAAGTMFAVYQSNALRETIRTMGTRQFDQSALFCGKFLVRQGMGKFAGTRLPKDTSGLYLDVQPDDITVLPGVRANETEISLRGFCAADNSSEIQVYTVRMLLDLEAGQGNIIADSLVMHAESGI